MPYLPNRYNPQMLNDKGYVETEDLLFELTAELENAGFDVCDSYEAIFVPDSDVLDECFERGKALAKSIKEE